MGVFWWIPALIPLIGALILLACPGKWAWPVARWEGAESTEEAQKNWAKFGIFFAVNLIACLLFAWGSWTGAVQKTKFKEVWNFQITGIRHEMQWTTEESYTVEVDDGDTTDSEGNVTHHSHTETRYRTDTHGPYWYRIDEYGVERFIEQGEYDHWKREWKTEKPAGMHKGSAAGWDKKIDGPIFACSWPQTFETIWPETAVWHYVNKIRVSHSVLKWGEATREMKAKYPRPVDKGNTGPVVVYGGPGVSGDDMLYLRRINARFGSKYQVHSILVLLGKDADRGVISDILTAWQGPNMNELVTFVSVDGNNLRFVEVHSWMDNTTLHATLRDELMGQPFSAHLYGQLLQQYIPKMWHRKDFTPINAYLHVDISWGWIILALVLSIICGIVSYFVIENVVEDKWDGGCGYRYTSSPLYSFRRCGRRW